MSSPAGRLLAKLLFRLEPLWSAARAGDAPVALPEVPPGLGEWRVGFGPQGDLADPQAYARHAVLSGACAVVTTITVTPPGGEIIRLRCVSGVAPHSARETAARLVARANAMPAFLLKKADGRPPADFFALLRRQARLLDAEKPPAPPGAPQPFAHLRRLLRELRQDLFSRKQWCLLVGDNLDRAPEPERLRRIKPPQDRIWADPFLVEAEGQAWVFFEEMLHREKRGRIAVARWDGKRLLDAQPALIEPHHLSFPQVFTHAGRRRLIAEAAASGGLTVYDCVRWPDRWTPAAKIFDRPIIDPSLFEHEGRWWLFGNLAIAPGAKADDDLHLFHTDDPISGRWTPHPLNPVVSDARFARGAGRPYRHNGKLYRPAQDCAGGYGRRVVVREITTLTPEAFAECTVGALSPSELGPDAVALHTLNPGRRFVACDFAVRR